MWTCPKKGKQGEENFERNLKEHEVFTKTIPTSFIMTFLMFFLNVAFLNCKCREWSEEVPNRVHLFHISSNQRHFHFPFYNDCHHEPPSGCSNNRGAWNRKLLPLLFVSFATSYQVPQGFNPWTF